MLWRRVGGDQILFTVADAVVVLPPSQFARIDRDMRAGDMIVNTDLRATQAGEKRLGLVGASFAIGIGFAVIDPLCQEARM